MTARLLRDQVARHLAKLRPVLTTMQAARLEAIIANLADDGRFLLRDALVAAEFPEDDTRGQEAFQDFRKRVNQAAEAAGVELALELDSRKRPPDERHGWFTGGDLVDDSIALFTGETASRTGIKHPVDQAVIELDTTRVYVSFLPPEGRAAARKVESLLKQLRDALRLEPGSWKITDTASAAVLGEDPEAVRDRLCAQADVRVVLVTPDYLTGDSRERDRALRSSGRVVAFPLTGLHDGLRDLGALHIHDVLSRDKPWFELRAEQHRHYISEVVGAIWRALRTPVIAEAPDLSLIRWSADTARKKRAEDSEYMVEPEIAETTLQESDLRRTDRAQSNALPAVERLVDWACGGGTQRLCALLGDVGMGKTTTAKLFTQRLLERREKDTTIPLPILFDLREARISDLTQRMTLDNILTTMLDANRPAGAAKDRLTADVVRERVRQGNAVVVFDGLDEVLVHLGPHDQRLFTRQLWRAVDEKSDSKMLLTCRTQYFRTIREETTYFLGQNRQGLRGEHYLALLMLPFREGQVREYLATNLGRDESWVDGFLATLAGIHNLPDLARRPLTLRLIADQVEFIETAKLQGRTLRAVDLYREYVHRWLSWDDGKHTLLPEHKQLLMEQLAAGLWRSGQNSWEPAQVEDWLLDLLGQRPDLQRHYRDWVPDLWKADFRTATFLSRERDSDTFSFGHRSLFEYFLASYLCRALTDPGASAGRARTDADVAADRALEAWAMPVPSPETLDFLGQSIAGLHSKQRSAALATLRRIAASYVPHTSELALAYALHAADHGHPRQSLVGVQLPGARLEGWAIGSNDDKAAGHDRPRLPLTGANLTGADLRRARFNRVDLTGADLSGADLTNTELHGSRLASARLAGARAAGTILRNCEIDGVDLASADAYQAQLLRCTPQTEPALGWLVAPMPAPTRPPVESALLRPLTGHSGRVNSVAYSPDGTHILTGSDDHTARIWDATTGAPLHQLTGHTDWVNAVAYSPDGTHILTGSNDPTARIWDATTGARLHQLTGHTSGVRSVAYSPDGTRILTGSADHTARVWDATTGAPTGFTLIALPGGEVVVFDAVSQVLIGASDGAWRWLGWTIVQDGRLTRLPAETYGDLPPLRTPD